MSELSPEETTPVLPASEDDPDSRRALRVVTFLLFLAGFMAPFTADAVEDLRQQVWFGRKCDVTIAPRPDRLQGEFIASAQSLRQMVAAAADEDESESGKPVQEPLTFWKRIKFVWESANKWLRESPDQKSTLGNEFYFWALGAVVLFIIAAKVFGVNKVSAFLSGLIGADRVKKIIIDTFLLKGVEKTIFPTVKTALTRANMIASHSINRVELHDIVRVNVSLQGDGSIECWRESVTVEGRTAYTYCPSLTGSGGDYYFNLQKVTGRSVKINGDLIVNASSQKGHVGRVKFDITGFKSAAWE